MSIINIDLTKAKRSDRNIVFKKEEFTLDSNGQNTFTLSHEVQSDSETVHLNGLLLKSKTPNSDYSILNQTLNINIETHISDLITIAYATVVLNNG